MKMRDDCPYNRFIPCVPCGGTGLEDVEGEKSELVVGPVCTVCNSEGMINTHKEPCLWCSHKNLEDIVSNLVSSLKIIENERGKNLDDLADMVKSIEQTLDLVMNRLENHIGDDDSHDVVV